MWLLEYEILLLMEAAIITNQCYNGMVRLNAEVFTKHL